MVDTEGFLLRVWVHAADLADSTAAWWWLALIGEAFPTLRIIFADGAYTGPLVDWARDELGLTIEIVKRAADQQGFVVLPRRWVVERTFAWFGRNRRLAKDFEQVTECSETWIYLASIRLLLARRAKQLAAAA